MKPGRDVPGLSLCTHRRGMRRQIARRRDQSVSARRRSAQVRMQAHRRLEILNRVEVAILTQQSARERRSREATP